METNDRDLGSNGMSAAGPPQGANSAPAGGSAAAKPQAWGDHPSTAGRRWVYPAIVVVLLLVIAAMAWKFIVAGSTAPAADGRVAVMLAPAERALVLGEMRGFVAGVERIVDAASRDDMQALAAAARTMGGARMHDAPVAMMGKLPLPFKKLAFGVHRGFDALAAEAEGGGTPKQSLAALAGILQQCVACHAAYALGTPASE